MALRTAQGIILLETMRTVQSVWLPCQWTGFIQTGSFPSALPSLRNVDWADWRLVAVTVNNASTWWTKYSQLVACDEVTDSRTDGRTCCGVAFRLQTVQTDVVYCRRSVSPSPSLRYRALRQA